MKPADQIPLPLPRSVEEMSDDACKRLREFINRSAGQHLRAMRQEWDKTKVAA